MNKIIIVLLVLGVAIGIYSFQKNKTAQAPVVENTEELVTNQNTSQKKQPFSQFITMGGSYACSVRNVEGDAVYTKDVYVKDGKVTGEYRASGKTHAFIARDGVSYTWDISTKTGTQAPMRLTEDEFGERNGWSIDYVGDYDCKIASMSETEFAIPSEVKFADIEAKPVLN